MKVWASARLSREYRSPYLTEQNNWPKGIWCQPNWQLGEGGGWNVCGHPGTRRTPGSAACPEQSPSESTPGRATSQQGLNIKLRLFPARVGRGQKSPGEQSFPEGLFTVSLGAGGDVLTWVL